MVLFIVFPLCFFMRNSEDEYLVVSASIALLYAIACVFYFTKFVYNVAISVQLNHLVTKLYKEAESVAEDRKSVV